MNLERYRAEADEFLRRMNEEHYRHGAGLKETLEAAPMVEEYAHLFERRVCDRLADELSRADPNGEAARRLRYLRTFAVEGYLAAAAREAADRLGTAEATAVVSFEGRELPYRAVPVRLANEADRERRRRLAAARDRVTEKVINPPAEGFFRALHGAACTLGYAGYLSLYREIAPADLQALSLEMKTFLAETDAVYRAHLETALARVGVAAAKGEKQDLAYLFRAPGYDTYFAADRAFPALEATLAGMGIDFRRQENIVVDAAARPRKSPRAFCAPVRPGEEVCLVIAPHGGMDDYQALFHEAGHAEHFAHCGPDLAFEYRRLGDNAVTEAFAFLLQYLTVDPDWCGEFLNLRDPEFFRFTAFQKLYMLRRYAAKLLYELELHGAGEGARPGVPADMAPAYARILGEALLVAHPEAHYLTDVDPGFYVADYLRAWALSALLAEFLKERHGRRWYASHRAGSWLRELWSAGQRYTAEELAEEVGYPGLGFEPLMQELKTALV